MDIEIRDRFNKYMDNDAPKQLKRLFDDLNEGDGIMLQSCFEDFTKSVLEQQQESRPHETIVIGEIESHIKSIMIEADEHAKMGNYAKALSLKEQTTGFKRAIDVIRKHLSQ